MNRQYILLLALVALLFSAAPLAAQPENDKVSWKVLTPLVTGAPGEVVEVKIEAKLAPKSHLYTTKKFPDSLIAPQPTEVSVGEKGLFGLGGRVKGPKPIAHKDENFDGLITEYWEGTVVLTVPVKISKKAKVGKSSGWVNFYFMTCNDSQCMPPSDKKLTFEVEIADKASADSTADSTNAALMEKDTAAPVDTVAAVDTAANGHDTVAAAPISAPDNGKNEPYVAKGSAQEIEQAKSEGLMAFLLLAAGAGLGALATPCVFPMIPITVSFFTKRKHTSRVRNIRDALLYALGIILTFTALGLILTAVLGATGANDFAANPIVNLLIAGVFMVLALNLFGLFEIQLPTGVLNRLNAKANEDSIWGVMLMGLVFSLTSFTCTFGFVGGLLVSAANGELLWPLLGTATFATVFAAPFFLLALFPGMLKSMPKSGGWLNSVKVVMGFLEVAFAFKFVSNADMSLEWEVFTRGAVLAIWVAVAVLITLYLLGHFRLPHDTPVEKIGPIRVMFAIGFLASGFWLLTGLFDKSLGELDAQLPPPDYGTSALVGSPAPVRQVAVDDHAGGAAEKDEEDWIQDDYEKALLLARETNKPLFVDFTGYNCTNCRWMELKMFPRKDVAELMSKYVLVRLYTDRPNEINKKNQKMMYERYKTVALPYYVLISPTDSTIAEFPGMTREPEEFVGFLRRGLKNDQITAR